MDENGVPVKIFLKLLQ